MKTDAEEAIGTSFPSGLPIAEWELHKAVIRDLYIVQNLPLKDVQKILKERYNFNASTKQWKQQLKLWAFKKYIPAGDMDRIVESLAKTNLETLSKSHPYVNVHGRQVLLSRIKRHAQRTRSPLWREVSLLDASKPASPRATHNVSIADDNTLVDGADDGTPEPIIFAKDQAFDFAESPLPISLSSTISGLNDTSQARSDQTNFQNVSCFGTMQSNRRGSDHTATKLFACPYFKHNPLKFSARNTTELMYRSCATVVLRNTAAIKQHLYRVHKLPDHYCGRCHREFAKASDLNSHETSCSCETPQKSFEGKMTQDQYRKVKKRQTQSDQQNGWYEIFDILFPQMPKPASPYIEDNENHESVHHVVNLFQTLGLDKTQALYDTVTGSNAAESLVRPLPEATLHVLKEAYSTFMRYCAEQPYEQWMPPLTVASPACIPSSDTYQNSLAYNDQGIYLDSMFPAASFQMSIYAPQLDLANNHDGFELVELVPEMDDPSAFRQESMQVETGRPYMDFS